MFRFRSLVGGRTSLRSDPSTFPRLRSLASLLLVLVFATSAFAADEDADADPSEHAHEHQHDHEDAGITETIVVTGSPLQHDRDELALPVDRIDRDELLRELGGTLGDTLNHIPGITSSGFTAGASRPVIRGQDAFRTTVLEDGLSTQDVSQESPDHAVPINPLAAQRVEVVRGPATLRYGGGASAGVVNTITKRVPDRLPTETVTGDIYAGIGLLADERDIAASLDGAFGSFAWHADGVLRTANNYGIPNDGNPHTQPGSDYDSFAGSLGGAYFFDDARLGFSYTRVENDYGIPEDEPVDIEMHTDRYRFEADLENKIPGIRTVRLRGVYSDYEHDEIADGAIGQTYRNEEFEGRLEVLHEPVMGFLGAVGFQAKTRDFRGEGEAAEFLSPTDSESFAVYFVEERPLTEALSVEVGFRVEHARVQGEDAADLQQDESFVPLGGALGFVLNPTDWLTIGAQSAVSQRAPSQVELFARGPHEATSTFERGDTRLGLETSYTGELRAEAKGSRGRIEFAGFVTHYDDFIIGQLTGQTLDEDGAPVLPTDPEALDELVYQSRDAVFYGGEMSFEFDLYECAWGTLGIDGRFDAVRARFQNGPNRDLPRIVPIRWGSGLFFAAEQFDGRIGFLRNEAQERTGAGERPTASFTYLNASAAYRLALFEDRVPLEFTIVARNLLDVRGRNHVSLNKEEVLLPGRNIRFGLRAQF